MSKGKQVKLVEVAVIVAVLAALPGLLWCSILTARESARRAACLNNLKQIITGIKTYTPDYDEYYPTSAKPGKEINVETHYRDLGILYPTYITSLDVFTCPSSGDRMPRRVDDSNDNKPFLDREAEQVSYAYSYDGRDGKSVPWTEAATSTTRPLADRPATKELTEQSNHGVDGRNVAFADGHVRWTSGKQQLLTDPDNPDPKINTQSWWSERPDVPRERPHAKRPRHCLLGACVAKGGKPRQTYGGPSGPSCCSGPPRPPPPASLRLPRRWPLSHPGPAAVAPAPMFYSVGLRVRRFGARPRG